MSPPVPREAAASATAQAAYLLEDGFAEAPEGALADKLATGKPLRVKFGVDPTAPAVTWGWAVPLRRLRRFQELGHTAVLVIGDFTAQVGDPSGRSATRVRLSADQVEAYIAGCMDNLLEILSPDNLEVRRNSEWLGALGPSEMLDLTSSVTVAQLLERHDFANRFKAQEPISVTEFMYPLLQGQDSVAVRADVELGGTDQHFNLMLARHLQQRAGQEPQACVTAPLLVGTDGSLKMSQSYGNYIGVSEPPREIYGKAMSIPDAALLEYLNLATDLRPAEKRRLADDLLRTEPMRLKRLVAREMVAMFHGREAADEAEAHFDRVFVRREAPADIPTVETSTGSLPRLLVELGWAKSLSEARRHITGRGVQIDDEVVESEQAELTPGTYVVRFGRRRYARVRVRPA
ncbi:MAG: tyrosine--tRNA ligase [Pseudonocardiaceae bacterium]